MKLKVAIALFVVTLLIISGVACHRVSYSADDPNKIRVGIVFDIGGKDDRSFNAAAWVGVKCAETGHRPDGQPCLDDREIRSRRSTSSFVMSNRAIRLRSSRRCARLRNVATT